MKTLLCDEELNKIMSDVDLHKLHDGWDATTALLVSLYVCWHQWTCQSQTVQMTSDFQVWCVQNSSERFCLLYNTITSRFLFHRVLIVIIVLMVIVSVLHISCFCTFHQSCLASRLTVSSSHFSSSSHWNLVPPPCTLHFTHTLLQRHFPTLGIALLLAEDVKHDWLSVHSLPPAHLSWKSSDKEVFLLQCVIIYYVQCNLLSTAAWYQCYHPLYQCGYQVINTIDTIRSCPRPIKYWQGLTEMPWTSLMAVMVFMMFFSMIIRQKRRPTCFSVLATCRRKKFSCQYVEQICRWNLSVINQQMWTACNTLQCPQ